VATTYRYLAVGEENEEVLGWFRRADPPPAVVETEPGTWLWLHFRAFGPLGRDATGAIDVDASPLVGLIPAGTTRGVLWTAGEVHFRTKRLPRVFPPLERVRDRFHRWLQSFDLVWDGRSSDWEYFLEGSIQNYESPVYALPGAMAALRQGAYFVTADETQGRLDSLCKKLALRGVQCTDNSPTG
jgi:hypothetical protein